MCKEDKREPLPNDSELKLSGSGGGSYYISEEIGRGGSCIVYRGIKKDSAAGQAGENGFSRMQIIKEFYPFCLTGLSREGASINVPSEQKESFNEHKE